MAEKKDGGKKKGKKKKRAEAVYVPVAYPLWLGAASFGWAVVGWLIAAFAPGLAFVPGAGALHYLFPTVTAGLLGVNLYLAVRNLLGGAHVLRLCLITGVEMALFTTLFFQLYAHIGAELYDSPGPTSPWQWFQFSLAHAFRAGDVFDMVEAYGWGIQTIKHSSPLVGVVVIAYHVVVDVFFLGLVWAVVGRFREDILADDEFRGLLIRIGFVAFAVWFLAFVIVAFFYRPWGFLNVPLWFIENFFRVVDFADIMESFGIRLHTLPRDGVVGTLTFFCRLWIGLGLAALLTRRRKPPERRVLTPPGEAAGKYWWTRVGALTGMTAGLFLAGVVGWLASGSSAGGLAAAVKAGPDDRAQAALRALRRMGPGAGAAVPDLVAARADVPAGVRDEITRTLGYLGTGATAALRDIALTDPPESAGLAVDSLGAVGGAAAPDLVLVWEKRGEGDPVGDRAGARLKALGGACVDPLMDGFNADNAYGRYVWLQKIDTNWRLRNTTDPTCRACQGLPDLMGRTDSGDAKDAADALGSIRACGSAAKVVLDKSLVLLNHKDPGLVTAAAGVVIAAGPSVTPKVLEIAAQPNANNTTAPGAITALNAPELWDESVYAHPQTLPTLLLLAQRGEGFPIALRRLGHYGKAAAPAAPVFLPHVADQDESTRAAVREALGKLKPDWKSDPALTAALPALLYKLDALPKAEADELYAAFGTLTADQGDSVGRAVGNQLKEVNSQFRGVRDKDGLAAYAQALDGVYGPVERLGVRAKTVGRGLDAVVRANAREYNDARTKYVTERLMKTLPLIGHKGGASAELALSKIGYNAAGFEYLKKEGKEALSTVGHLIGEDAADKRFLGYRAAAALGPDAAALVPDLVRKLYQANKQYRVWGVDGVWELGELVAALNAVAPDWWARADALDPVARLVRIPIEREGEDRDKILDMLAAAGPRVGKAAGPIVAECAKRTGIDADLAAALDKCDPKWRDSPEVKKLTPELLKVVGADRRDTYTERTLIAIGGAAAPDIAAWLDGMTGSTLGVGPEYNGAQATFRRMKLMITGIGEAARPVSPNLIGLLAKSEIDPGNAALVLETLDTIEPGWVTKEAYKERTGKAAEALLKRGQADLKILPLAARCGAQVVPELARRLASAPVAERTKLLAGLASTGAAGKAAVPEVLKLVADKDKANDGVRVVAIETLAKIGDGDPAIAPALAPLLLDPDERLHAPTTKTLDAVDPKWRTKPAAKQVVTAATAQLKSADAGKRWQALDAIKVAGAGDAALVPTLAPLIIKESDGRAGNSLRDALNAADPAWRTKPAAKAVIGEVVKQLSHPMSGKRFEALQMLYVVGRAEGVAEAVERVRTNDPDQNLRGRAAGFLEAFPAKKP